ncbi:cysteine desulfurase NifS [candidate division WOR-3 bacterium 4484_100]|uniref:Cysteine desulfurase n=1 Tax=candidate division WOR-3 bacterium 4484_100 TaxID=1936077 RepID=A0A1V4QGV1_UNCW3|nr:MAG: cysteine desulfurase NifS [candidate division WOR-3 bacterium 4484_100]
MIYLDYNATAPTDPRVIEAMRTYFAELYANPSSIHTPGQKAKQAVEHSREVLANFLNARPEEVYFTSGGTEADNLAIKGLAFAQDKRKKIIYSSIEHHAVMNTCKYMSKFGYEIISVPVDRYGVVDLNFIEEKTDEDTLIISVMHANNEVGTIQPIREIAQIAHKYGAVFHTDAVQTVGKIDIDIMELEVDMLSLSGHKFYGPKGVGALIVKKGIKFDALLHGGHHERNHRAGTENVPGIVGLAKACELAQAEIPDEEKRLKELRDRLWQGLNSQISEIQLNGHPEKRLANTLNFSVKYVEGESLILSLNAESICASTGSACSSGSLEPSHVLLAMGIPAEIAHGSLRFSLGRWTKPEEIEKVIDVLPGIVEKLRQMSPLYKK